MKLIVHTLPIFVHFTALLALPFSQPQLHNLQVWADALCVAPNRARPTSGSSSSEPTAATMS